MKTSTKETSIDSDSPLAARTINVSWPDLNTSRWKLWGFPAEKVIKPARYHALFQQVRTVLMEKSGDSPGFEISGRIFILTETIERKLSLFMWPAYFLGIIFISLMIRMALSGNGLQAALYFLLAYALFDGYMPIALRLLAESVTSGIVVIKWADIDRLLYFMNQGVMLIGWNDSGQQSCNVSIGFDRNFGEKLFDRLKAKLSPEAYVRSLSQERYGYPPEILE